MTGKAFAAPTIEAQITYLAPGSFINRRFVAPGKEVNTGEYRSYSVSIRDARPYQADFTLNTHGFTLTSHRSAVRDFLDKDEVNTVYPSEVAAAIQQLTGADRVATMGWMARTSGDLSRYAREEVGYRHQGGVQPPAGEAHVDSSPDRVDRMAQTIYQQRFAGDPPYRVTSTQASGEPSPPRRRTIPWHCVMAIVSAMTKGSRTRCSWSTRFPSGRKWCGP
jgi:hypothetical protein